MQKLSYSELLKQIELNLECLKLSGVDWVGKTIGNDGLLNVAKDPQIPNQLSNQVDLKAIKLNPSQPAKTELTILKRGELLESLKAEVKDCGKCTQLVKTRKSVVFGGGKIEAEICFIGEAPGIAEDEKGEPFVGEAGALLDKILIASGLKRSDAYFLNIIRCLPPENRLPLPAEVSNCSGFLERQISLVSPKLICCLGSCAAEYILNSKIPVSKLRGRLHDWNGIPVLCTYHPAVLIRNPEKKRDVWEDMKFMIAYLGRSLPAT